MDFKYSYSLRILQMSLTLDDPLNFTQDKSFDDHTLNALPAWVGTADWGSSKRPLLAVNIVITLNN